ncbi:hypothetical protein GCM10009830_19930 [Glycomyces endophyticus]|uniref:Uncharacterized protein n=1 Tax=Glycomyces endophyticus TaxID=480996 RepID=A0ABP4SL98_9ACTN
MPNVDPQQLHNHIQEYALHRRDLGTGELVRKLDGDRRLLGTGRLVLHSLLHMQADRLTGS